MILAASLCQYDMFRLFDPGIGTHTWSGLSKIMRVVELCHIVGIGDFSRLRDIGSGAKPKLSNGFSSIIQTRVSSSRSGY